MAGIGESSGGSGLGALIEEDDAGAVDDVGLHGGDIQDLLRLRNPYHVVVGGSADLRGRDDYDGDRADDDQDGDRADDSMIRRMDRLPRIVIKERKEYTRTLIS